MPPLKLTPPTTTDVMLLSSHPLPNEVELEPIRAASSTPARRTTPRLCSTDPLLLIHADIIVLPEIPRASQHYKTASSTAANSGSGSFQPHNAGLPRAETIPADAVCRIPRKSTLNIRWLYKRLRQPVVNQPCAQRRDKRVDHLSRPAAPLSAKQTGQTT